LILTLLVYFYLSLTIIQFLKINNINLQYCQAINSHSKIYKQILRKTQKYLNLCKFQQFGIDRKGF
ncbi:hypothetical protein ABPG72_008182, partial [Tetrahymena utriculariae]